MPELNKIYTGDCLEIMRSWPDKCIDLILTDPPFGIGNFVQATGRVLGKKVMWNDATPSIDYFNEMKRISKERIIWGANYFNCFEKLGGALVWDKHQTMDDYSKVEIASCSFHKRTEIFHHTWKGGSGLTETNHPCERPIELYLWCLQKYSLPSDIIFDPFCGSGSSLKACERLQRKWIGCEINPDYVKVAEERIVRERAQLKLAL